MTDPMERIAYALERIADALERQAPPSMVIKADPPLTDAQAEEISRKMFERLRKRGGH